MHILNGKVIRNICEKAWKHLCFIVQSRRPRANELTLQEGEGEGEGGPRPKKENESQESLRKRRWLVMWEFTLYYQLGAAAPSPVEGGRKEQPVTTCHRNMWVTGGGSPVMPRSCLTG